MAAKVLTDADARRLAMNIAGMLPANRVMRDRVIEYLARVVPFLDGEDLRPPKQEDATKQGGFAHG